MAVSPRADYALQTLEASCAIFRISTGVVNPETVAITNSRSKERPSIGRVTRPGAAAERSGRMQIAWPSATTRCTPVLSFRPEARRPRRLSQDVCAVHPESSRTNADDRLPLDPLGWVEGGDGVVEGRDVADDRPQPSVPHPPDDLTQLGAIGHDDEV